MRHDERGGLLLALAGFALLSVGDAVIKTTSGQWSPIAVAALRFLFGAMGLSALLFTRQGVASFRPLRPAIQVLRGVCLAMASLGFFTAIFFMPLGEATALIFVAPILTALLSGPVLGERVTLGTIVASLVAFAGVLLVLRPNLASLGWIALLPLGSACFMSVLMLANRAVANDGSPLSMQAFLALAAAPTLILAACAGDASGIGALDVGAPAWSVVARCAIVALTASTAHWLVYLATTRAGPATIAPMTYVQLLVATALGWLWFGDRPDMQSGLGAVIIIASGLYLWWQGRMREPVENV